MTTPNVTSYLHTCKNGFSYLREIGRHFAVKLGGAPIYVPFDADVMDRLQKLDSNLIYVNYALDCELVFA